MKRDIIKAKVLACKIIPNISQAMAQRFGIPDGYKAAGLIACDIDDVTYTALDEATKAADVIIVYAKSMYAGSANASTKLAGEVIGIMVGSSPAEVKSGLLAAISFIENGAHFVSANDDDSIPYYAHCVSRTGSYLSSVAGIREGESIAYLIAPPLESIYGLDAALKAADVELKVLFSPPSETNFGGALLSGTQSACKAACDAFSTAVEYVAQNPTQL